MLVKSALIAGALVATTALAYEFPENAGIVRASSEDDAALDMLQAISRGTAALTKRSRDALVFLSIESGSTRTRTPSAREPRFGGVPDGLPFEFRFGPQQGGPREPQMQQALGSGFIFDRDKGYLLTNNHVVADADVIRLKLANGEQHRGKVIGRDARTDLAVVKIEGKFDAASLGELTLGDSDAVQPGHFALALGAPFGLEASASQGIVSAKGRGSLDIAELGDFIQTDAAINPGMSGGPLLDAEGKVIGVNTAIFTPNGGSRGGGFAGIGFAVPANIVRQVAKELVEHGTMPRGYLGLALAPTDDKERDHVQSGALVAEVRQGGPAASAGFSKGDVIVQVAGRVTPTVSAVTTAIGLAKPGSSVDFVILRAGKERKLSARIGDWPLEPRAS